MIGEKMQRALNEQINFEFYSAQLYLGMSNEFELMNFSGMAHWMRVQFNEELFHAVKIFDYIHARDGVVILKNVEFKKGNWNSPYAIFECAYRHEQEVTRKICELVDLALAEKDYVSHSTLQWFVKEQVEEERKVRDIMDRLRRISDIADALYRLDSELNTRVIETPQDLIDTNVSAI